jgi:hypothetical protein
MPQLHGYLWIFAAVYIGTFDHKRGKRITVEVIDSKTATIWKVGNSHDPQGCASSD